ncbi:hypothetical protein LQZ19_13045 [Treponema primitia]
MAATKWDLTDFIDSKKDIAVLTTVIGGEVVYEKKLSRALFVRIVTLRVVILSKPISEPAGFWDRLYFIEGLVLLPLFFRQPACLFFAVYLCESRLYNK